MLSVPLVGTLNFLHNLFTAFWVGGLLTLTLSLVPAARSVYGKEQTKKLVVAVQARLSKIVYMSIVGLALTGILLSKNSAGFVRLFMFGTAFQAVLSVKHILTLVMVALALGRSLVLPRLKLPEEKAGKLSMLFLMANMLVGVLMLALSGFAAALA